MNVISLAIPDVVVIEPGMPPADAEAFA